ncbi:MAG: ATP-binding cassette subfamily B protein [Planctomycetota bacterium]
MSESIPTQHDDTQPATNGINLALWRKLWRFAAKYPYCVGGIAFFALTTAFFDVALPWVTKDVIDALTSSEIELDIWYYAWIYFGLIAGLALSVLGFITAGGKLRTRVGHDIRQAGFENLQNLSFSYFDHRPVGWLMSRMTSDCERLTNILAWGLLDIVWGSATMLWIIIAMGSVDWRLALVILSVVPPLALVSSFFQKKILASSRIVRKTNSRITASYNEGIMGVRTTKAFVREAENSREFGEVTQEMNSASIRNALQSAVYLPIVMTLSSLALALVLGAGGGRVLSGAIQVGTLVLFISYSRLFFDPIQELARLFAEVQMAQASAERVISLIEAEPEIQDSAEVQLKINERLGTEIAGDGLAIDGMTDAIDRIEFVETGFQYAKGQKVLSGFNLSVNAGETIALVGQTGGGKSTILSLLCRFYEPTEGKILINGVDYQERSLHWLQSNLGIVLQEPQLFSGSVADNIRYGDLEASAEGIEAAAKLVGAHEFIEAMDDGYASEVGEGGGQLSTGQKQLISFARAILKSPQILVMDEATSSIDTETEKRIQEGLGRVLEGRTSFVIAHRLSTIRSADRIMVIERGLVVEIGSHAELMARRGSYHELYTGQSLRSAGRGTDEEDWNQANPLTAP